MPERDIYRDGGPKIDVAKTIKTIIGGMATGQKLASVVIKEFLQNADDAGANELCVFLDERRPPDIQSTHLRELCRPALIVRNNGPFHAKDFEAIQNIALEHKTQKAAAAGRFGIGFNSIYFLTDFPIIYSRREIHVFDILNRIWERQSRGVKLDLADLRGDLSDIYDSNEIKLAFDWMFPKVALGTKKRFQEHIDDEVDYSHSLFRIPLRGQESIVKRMFPDYSFPSRETREQCITEMALQARSSLVFLKNINSVRFGILEKKNSPPTHVESIRITPNPDEFHDVVRRIEEEAKKSDTEFEWRPSSYTRTLDIQTETTVQSRCYEIYHLVNFADEEIRELREEVINSDERATPWVSLGVPLDKQSLDAEGNNPPMRVVLPLAQNGPCATLMNGFFFVDPSRRETEFRARSLKTRWNLGLGKLLVSRLRDATLDFPDLLKDLILKHPSDYVALFPKAVIGQANSLPASIGKLFNSGAWLLTSIDVWGETIEDYVNDESDIRYVAIPRCLSGYKSSFVEHSSETLRFVEDELADAIKKRLPRKEKRRVEPPTFGVFASALSALVGSKSERKVEDLREIWSALPKAPSSQIENLPCCIDHSRQIIKYRQDQYYVVCEEVNKDHVLFDLERLGVAGQTLKRIASDVGIADRAIANRFDLTNIGKDEDAAVIELLRATANAHDRIESVDVARKLVDLLIAYSNKKRLPSTISLAVLIKTASQKHVHRSRFRAIFLKPKELDGSDELAWEFFYRRYFAQVDTRFAEQVFRLLDADLANLNSFSQPDCEVRLGDASYLLSDVIHFVALGNELVTSMQQLVHDFAGRPHVTEKYSSFVEILLRQAKRRWSSMSPLEQQVFRRLPIHRTNENRFISISDEVESYRLQSNEAEPDAPVTRQDFVLLNPAEEFRSFYEATLRIGVHDRVAVFRDVLSQFTDQDNESRLRAVKYLLDVLPRIEQSDRGKGFGEQLRTTIYNMPIVQCLGGTWETVLNARRTSQLEYFLVNQHDWDINDVKKTLGPAFNKTFIADPSGPSYEFFVLEKKLDELSFTECKDLLTNQASVPKTEFGNFARLLVAIDSSESDSGELPECLYDIDAPASGAKRTKLRDAIVPPAKADLALYQIVFPTAIDVDLFAEEVGIEERVARAALKSVSVRAAGVRELKDELKGNFEEVWLRSEGADELRVRILETIASVENAEMLIRDLPVCPTLDAKQMLQWSTGQDIVVSKLSHPRPPLLSEDHFLHTAIDLSNKVVELLDKVAGIADQKSLVRRFLEIAHSLSETQKKDDAAKAIHKWIDELDKEQLRDFTHELRKSDWVLSGSAESIPKFRSPPNVLTDSATHDLLKYGFDVPVIPLPQKIQHDPLAFGFLTKPERNSESLLGFATCLERFEADDQSVLLASYEKVAAWLGDDSAMIEEWKEVSQERNLLRRFDDGHCERVPRWRLYIGSASAPASVGDSLHAVTHFKVENKNRFVKAYEALYVEQELVASSLVRSLSRFSGVCADSLHAFNEVVNASSKANFAEIAEAVVAQVCLPACDGTYQCLASLYYDDQLGVPANVADASAPRLIDCSISSARKLARHIQKSHPKLIRELRWHAKTEICVGASKIDVTPEFEELIRPWEEFLYLLLNPASVVHTAVESTAAFQGERIKISCISKVRPVFNGCENSPALSGNDSWNGYPIFFDRDRRELYISQYVWMQELSKSTDPTRRFDSAIVREFASALSKDKQERRRIRSKLNRATDDFLIRPSQLIDLLRTEIEDHLLYEFSTNNFVAEFEQDYDRLKMLRPESGEYKELKASLLQQVKELYLEVQRKSIRDYGYGKHSVIAELIQNAEDAYGEAAQLGMELPVCCVVGISTDDNHPQFVDFQHGGRPFNYWRHHGAEREQFKNDVRGLLRLRGSQKLREEGSNQIGRFGLGFKSVFLICDEPEIHSGNFHFSIKDARIPRNVPPLSEDNDLTVFRLRGFQDEEGDFISVLKSHLHDHLVFLNRIRRAEVVVSGEVSFTEINTAATQDVLGVTVDHLTVSGKTFREINANVLRLKRGDAQLAILLDRKTLPTRWSNDFTHDFYSGLPIVGKLSEKRGRLGVGVALSHYFEVQAGRTGLVSDSKNSDRFAELASLLDVVPEIWRSTSPNASARDWFVGFWLLWKWERISEFDLDLTRIFSTHLCDLAYRTAIVPTYESEHLAKLGVECLFDFRLSPSSLLDVFFKHSIVFVVDSKDITIRPGNVVDRGFADSFRAAARAGQIEPQHARALQDLTWRLLAETVNHKEYFFRCPEFFNDFAACFFPPSSPSEEVQLTHNQCENLSWVSECLFADLEGTSRQPANMLSPNCIGIQLLPERLIQQLSDLYEVHAVRLLEEFDLLLLLPSDWIRRWLQECLLSTEESGLLIEFLHLMSRHEGGADWPDYRDSLRNVVRGDWVPHDGEFVSPLDARDNQLFLAEWTSDDEFLAWLGEGGHLRHQPPRRQYDAATFLNALADWWDENHESYVQVYNGETYPYGKLELESKIHDPYSRKQWLTLFLRASFFTWGEGFFKNVSHRKFLESCQEEWMPKVFAKKMADIEAQDWIDSLDRVIDECDSPYFGGGNQSYWMVRSFVTTYKFTRYLDEFQTHFLALDEVERVAPRSILNPAFDIDLQGTGEFLPSIESDLGIGFCFMIRELIRHRMVQNELLHEYAFVPQKSICDFLEQKGWCAFAQRERFEKSPQIWRLVKEAIGRKRATFHGCFDIPLLVFLEDYTVRTQLDWVWKQE